MEGRRPVKDLITEKVGFCPKDALGWLYVARAFYKLKDFHAVIECVPQTLRNEKTKKEGQHLLAFSLVQTLQFDQAATAFVKSIHFGNDSDWQPLVEMLMDHEDLKI